MLHKMRHAWHDRISNICWMASFSLMKLIYLDQMNENNIKKPPTFGIVGSADLPVHMYSDSQW